MRKMTLCISGGCPFIAEEKEHYVIFDDTMKIRVEKMNNGIKIFIPKDWGKRISKFMMDELE